MITISKSHMRLATAVAMAVPMLAKLPAQGQGHFHGHGNVHTQSHLQAIGDGFVCGDDDGFDTGFLQGYFTRWTNNHFGHPQFTFQTGTSSDTYIGLRLDVGQFPAKSVTFNWNDPNSSDSPTMWVQFLNVGSQNVSFYEFSQIFTTDYSWAGLTHNGNNFSFKPNSKLGSIFGNIWIGENDERNLQPETISNVFVNGNAVLPNLHIGTQVDCTPAIY